MSQLKAKTMMQKVGFLDPDKKTPMHDKIQKWVYNNVEKTLEGIISKESQYKIVSKEWEYVLETTATQYNHNTSVVGFVDLKVVIQSLKTNDYREIFYEIKSEIPSLGELIRQLRFYEKYIPYYTNNRKIIIVVSPNDEHKDLLMEQKFYFCKYKDESSLF